MISYLLQIIAKMYSSGLLLDELKHGLVALIFALWLVRKTKQVKYGLIVMLVAYLIDLDHLTDYWLYSGINFDILRSLNFDYFRIMNRAVVPLHAWEWVLILVMIAKSKKWKSLATPLSVGIFAHLLVDAWTQKSILFYSIIYRITTGFVLPH